MQHAINSKFNVAGKTSRQIRYSRFNPSIKPPLYDPFKPKKTPITIAESGSPLLRSLNTGRFLSDLIYSRGQKTVSGVPFFGGSLPRA
jgi:hypothetical protein